MSTPEHDGERRSAVEIALELGLDTGFDLDGGVDLPRATEAPDPERYRFERPGRRR